ncbi:MAG: hypothetical protein PWP39_290 [Pyrococcus sp.]|nr:hypothetical protein [Pyrococcus sp.]
MRSPKMSPTAAMEFFHEHLVVAKKAPRVRPATVPKTASSVNLVAIINRKKKEQETKQVPLKHSFQTHLLNVQSQYPQLTLPSNLQDF